MNNNNDYVDHQPRDRERARTLSLTLSHSTFTVFRCVLFMVYDVCLTHANNNSALYSIECTAHSSYLCVKYDDICEIGLSRAFIINPTQKFILHIQTCTFQMQTPSSLHIDRYLCVFVSKIALMQLAWIVECIWMKK